MEIQFWSFTTESAIGLTEYYQLNEFKVYPNPASDRVSIKADSSIDQVEIYNHAGQLVKNTLVNSNLFNLNVSDLETGIYFVKIYSHSNTITKKLLIE